MSPRVVRLASTAGAAALILLTTCNGNPAGPGQNQGGGGVNNPTPTTQVSLIDNSFNPANIMVSAGATVTWTWMGGNQHNVTFDDASIGNSGTMTAGTFNATFPNAGTFTYLCTIHGRGVMSGSVLAQ